MIVTPACQTAVDMTKSLVGQVGGCIPVIPPGSAIAGQQRISEQKQAYVMTYQ